MLKIFNTKSDKYSFITDILEILPVYYEMIEKGDFNYLVVSLPLIIKEQNSVIRDEILDKTIDVLITNNYDKMLKYLILTLDKYSLINNYHINVITDYKMEFILWLFLSSNCSSNFLEDLFISLCNMEYLTILKCINPKDIKKLNINRAFMIAITSNQLNIVEYLSSKHLIDINYNKGEFLSLIHI